MRLGKHVQMRLVVERLVAHVQADHRQPPARLENDLRSFRIVVDICFGSGVHVAARDRAVHNHHFLHQRNNRRIFQHRQSDIRQRPDRHQRDLVRRFVHHLDDQVRPEARICFAFARGQIHVGQPVCAVPQLRCDQLLKKRMLRAACYRDVAAIGERSQLQRVFQSLLGGHVAGDDRQRAHVQFRRIHSQQNRQRVIRAGVCINNYFLGSDARRLDQRRARRSIRSARARQRRNAQRRTSRKQH